MNSPFSIFDVLSFVATVIALVLATWISFWAYRKDKKKEIKNNFENSFESTFTKEFIRIYDDFFENKNTLDKNNKIYIEKKDELWIYLKRMLKLIDFIKLNENSKIFRKMFIDFKRKIDKNKKSLDKILGNQNDDILKNHEINWKNQMLKPFNNKKISFDNFLRYLQKVHFIILNLLSDDIFEDYNDLILTFRTSIYDLTNGVFFNTKDYLSALYEFALKFRKIKILDIVKT